MILESLIALILGIIIGTFTGLFPGIHINLVAAFLLSISPFLLKTFPPISLAVFIASLTITHTFTDYIPSIFLGAPEETSFLSVLPGHKLLLQGNGHPALVYTLYGCLIALPIMIILTPLFIFLLPVIYPYIVRIMSITLILFSLFMILTEKQKNKIFYALIIFLMSGFLGIATLNLNLTEPLLPLFTGLFGASSLIITINQKTKIPLQQITPLNEIKLSKKSLLESTFISLIVSPIPAFLPGLGASQAATIGTEIKSDDENKKESQENEKEFLFLVGVTNLLVTGLSFIALYSINKTRTGAAVAIQKLIPKLTITDLSIIITTIIISGFIAFIISVNISKFFAKNINKINYSTLSIIILLILILATFLFTSWLGILILIISTSLGITAILIGIKRTNLMGCLLVPTILYYLI
jgi:putative membrane protein